MRKISKNVNNFRVSKGFTNYKHKHKSQQGFLLVVGSATVVVDVSVGIRVVGIFDVSVVGVDVVCVDDAWVVIVSGSRSQIYGCMAEPTS